MREDPLPGLIPGLCMANVSRRLRLRFARPAEFGPPESPRVRGKFGADGALANGISVDREVDGIGMTEASAFSADGAKQ